MLGQPKKFKKTPSLCSLIIFMMLFFYPNLFNSPYAYGKDISKKYKYTHNTNVWPKLYEGNRVNANLFVPISDDPKEKFPAVIMICSWGMTEYEYYFQGERYAENGYIALLYDPRGWYEGELEVASKKDIEDLKLAVDWLIQNTPVAKNEKGEYLLAAGAISYGSIIILRTVPDEVRIKTVFALSGFGDGQRAMYGADTPHRIMNYLLLFSGNLFGKVAPSVMDRIYKVDNNIDIEGNREFFRSRSPMNNIDKYNKRNIPIYLGTNMADELFWPNSFMDFYSRLTVPKRLDMNLGDHAQCESMGLLGFGKSYPWDRTLDWLDYWLKGKDTGIMKRAPVTMMIKRLQTRDEFEDWPSKKIVTKSYYLGPRGKYTNGSLNENPVNAVADSANIIKSGNVSGATAGIPLVSAPLESSTPVQVWSWIPGIRNDIGIVFETEKLSSDLMIRGFSELNIWIEPSFSKAQLIAHIYDVNIFGIGTMITHGPVTLHETAPGKPVKLSFETQLTSYNIEKGHRLALAFDTYDPQYGVPTKEPFSIKFLYDKEHPSVLKIPVRKDEPGI